MNVAPFSYDDVCYGRGIVSAVQRTDTLYTDTVTGDIGSFVNYFLESIGSGILTDGNETGVALT